MPLKSYKAANFITNLTEPAKIWITYTSVLACTILLPCKVYGQQSESVRSNVHLNAIKLGYIPTEIAIDPTTNKLYVANSFSNTVSVIDTSTDKVVGGIGTTTGASDIAVDPSSKKVYLACASNNRICLIDIQSNNLSFLYMRADKIAVDPPDQLISLMPLGNS